MVSPQLLDYIRQQLAAGVSKEEISKALIANSWQVVDINEALAAFPSPQLVTPPPVVQAPIQNPVQPAISRGHKGVWATVIVLLLLVGAGGAYAAYQYGLFTSPTITTTVVLPSPVANTAVSTTSLPENSSASSTTQQSFNTKLPTNGTASIPTTVPSPSQSLAYDNAIKSDLRTIQLEADVYYNGSFAPGPIKAGAHSYGVPGKSCNTAGSIFVDPTIAASISHAQDQNGGALGYGGTPLTCNNSATTYAVSSKLFSTRTAGTPDYWCVDSAGASSESTILLSSATVCPTSN